MYIYIYTYTYIPISIYWDSASSCLRRDVRDILGIHQRVFKGFKGYLKGNHNNSDNNSNNNSSSNTNT